MDTVQELFPRPSHGNLLGILVPSCHTSWGSETFCKHAKADSGRSAGWQSPPAVWLLWLTPRS